MPNNFSKPHEMFEDTVEVWVKEQKGKWIGKSSTGCWRNMMNVLKKDFLRSKCRPPTLKMR